ncbi:sigma-70 family RNA polymerase sigma factor [Dokdonia sp.]|uniref:RNA polymerase sigma factor n=1 Tax=Dokdonia sp. TaxID=2024995 RepID=UPI003267D5CE
MNQQENQAFEKLLEDNKGKIYRICRIYAISPIEPQDLFQEVIYQVWKSFSSFKEQATISTWVYRIAINVCLRSKLKFEKNSLKTIRFDAIQFMASQDTSDQIEDEKYQFLRDCISSLPEGDQSIVILYLEEVAYKEIAVITGLTENHIAVKMKRIRKLLFDCITPKLN